MTGKNKLNIFVDIGHPGHVHLFRNLLSQLAAEGHRVLITARDKEVTLQLLKSYGFKFISRGKGYSGVLGKILGTAIITFKLLRHCRTFRPDLLIGGVGNIYIALCSYIIRRPSIICDDTEHARLELAVVRRFATHILTPSTYAIDLGRKQIRYPGYHEWAYLHPTYFTKTWPVISNLKSPDKYIIVRFVSWSAAHDQGKKGISQAQKKAMIEKLSKYARVYISAEGGLSEDLQPYRLMASPESIHQALASAALFIGEGATMASESVCLGTPAIYINPLPVPCYSDQQESGLLFQSIEFDEIVDRAVTILTSTDFKKEFDKRHEALFRKKIDVTALLKWIVVHYPQSIQNLMMDPNAVSRFLPFP